MEAENSSRFGVSERELLGRHLPLLRYDAQAPHRCIAVAAFTDEPGAKLRTAKGELIAARPAGPEEDGAVPLLGLELLARYPDGFEPRHDDRLDAPEAPLLAEDRFQSDPAYAERAYGVVREDEGGVWLQYWFFYLYNPANFLGLSRHEGDWELVQVGLDDEGRPRRATFAQHTWGDALEWNEVETVSGPEGERPVVYVAPLSNASYPHAGRFPYFGGVDPTRGDGRELTPRLEEFGPWHLWPGRWGNSKGVLGGLLGGVSPPAPPQQRDRWLTPSRFHARQQRPSLGRWYRRTLAAVTSTQPPPMPRISAGAATGAVRVAYEVDGTYPLQPVSVYASVHDGSDPERVLGYARVRIPPTGRGEIVIRVPAEAGEMFVRASAIDRRAQRSAPAEAPISASRSATV